MIYQFNEHEPFKANNLIKKHPHDAGWDIRTPIDFTLEPGGSVVIDTGLHLYVPKGLKAIIQSRSGCALNCKIEASNAGVIDYGYTGICNIGIYNMNLATWQSFKAGDRVAQVVFDFSHTVAGWDFISLYWNLFRKGLPQVVPEVPVNEWPSANEDRGEGGLNSTGLT